MDRSEGERRAARAAQRPARGGGHPGVANRRTVTASPQAPDPSLPRKRQSSLLPPRLLFPTRTASLGSHGGPEGERATETGRVRRRRQSSLPPLGFGGAPKRGNVPQRRGGRHCPPTGRCGHRPLRAEEGRSRPLRRKRRIRAGRPRKKMSFSDRMCLTQPVRDDILLIVFKDSRWAQAGNPAENAATTEWNSLCCFRLL